MFLETELVAALRDQRLPDGTTDSVGEVLVNWVRLVVCCAFILTVFAEFTEVPQKTSL